MADTLNRIEAKLRRPDTVGDEGWGVALDEDEAAALADAVEALRKIADVSSLYDGWEGLYRASDLAREALARVDGDA